MQDLDAFTITDAVRDQMSGTPDARLRQIMDAAVRHLHAFAREVDLTPAEWLAGIRFFTEVGHMCTPVRQEFILLSDVLGLSTLVNVLHDQRATESGTATKTSLLGPFYRTAAPLFELGNSIAAGTPGREIVMYGHVLDGAGKPVPRASVEVWQTDESGKYDLQRNDGESMDMRGRFHTDADGRYWFRTVRPLGYQVPLDGPVGRLVRQQNRHGCRPAHVHFLIGAEGFRELVTALYLDDDEHIDSDTVFGVSGALVVTMRNDDPDAPVRGMPAIRYDFRMNRAAGDGTGRVGADPSQLVGTAE